MPTACGLRTISAPPTGPARRRRRKPISTLSPNASAPTSGTRPAYFAELAERYAGEGFQAVARALGRLHEDEVLWQDAEGRHCLRDSRFAAQPPAARRGGS